MGIRRKTGAEQLEWAARNMHEWPDSAEEAGYAWENQVRFTTFNSPTPQGCVLFSRQQWLDRRAELQNKPSFADHPGAKCFVQNSDGTWFKHSGTFEASPVNGFWAQDATASGIWEKVGVGEVLGDWRDTLEKRLSEQAGPQEATDDAPSGFQPLTREQALQWTVDNVDWWHKAPLGPWVTPFGWSWEQACGNIYLMQVGEPCIGEMEWERAKREQTTSELNTMLEGSGFHPFTSLEDAQPMGEDKHVPEPLNLTALHTIHHAAFLHQGCLLLLSEPELVVFRTADGELIHCKPKECLIDPDVYGLAARLLADMSGHQVAPEHMRELVEQMNWRAKP